MRIAAAKSGHDVVMAPGTHTYLDHYQSLDPGEPLAIGGQTLELRGFGFGVAKLVGVEAELFGQALGHAFEALHANPRIFGAARAVLRRIGAEVIHDALAIGPRGECKGQRIVGIAAHRLVEKLDRARIAGRLQRQNALHRAQRQILRG